MTRCHHFVVVVDEGSVGEVASVVDEVVDEIVDGTFDGTVGGIVVEIVDGTVVAGSSTRTSSVASIDGPTDVTQTISGSGVGTRVDVGSSRSAFRRQGLLIISLLHISYASHRLNLCLRGEGVENEYIDVKNVTDGRTDRQTDGPIY